MCAQKKTWQTTGGDKTVKMSSVDYTISYNNTIDNVYNYTTQSLVIFSNQSVDLNILKNKNLKYIRIKNNVRFFEKKENSESIL